MPTTITPESPQAGPAPQDPAVAGRSAWRTIGWIALWTLLALILASFVLAGFLVARGSDSESVSAESAESPAPADADPTTETTLFTASLSVDSPEPGDLFLSGSSFSGTTSSDTIEYRLLAGGTLVAEGTVDAVDGTFSATIDFTNTCCIEMLLEVTQPGNGDMTVAVPLAFPESS